MVRSGGKETVWDSTLPPLEPRAYRVPLQELGGDAAEPVNVELRYMYVPEELTHRSIIGDEPTSRIIERRRLAPADIPSCDRP